LRLFGGEASRPMARPRTVRYFAPITFFMDKIYHPHVTGLLRFCYSFDISCDFPVHQGDAQTFMMVRPRPSRSCAPRKPLLPFNSLLRNEVSYSDCLGLVPLLIINVYVYIYVVGFWDGYPDRGHNGQGLSRRNHAPPGVNITWFGLHIFPPSLHVFALASITNLHAGYPLFPDIPRYPTKCNTSVRYRGLG